MRSREKSSVRRCDRTDEALVPGESTAELQLHSPDLKVEFVVNHHQPTELVDAVPLDQGTDRSTGFVVERGRPSDRDEFAANAQNVALGVLAAAGRPSWRRASSSTTQKPTLWRVCA